LIFLTLPATLKTFEEQGLDVDPARTLLDATLGEITTYLGPVSHKTVVLGDP
jgi:hypothetical protein